MTVDQEIAIKRLVVGYFFRVLRRENPPEEFMGDALVGSFGGGRRQKPRADHDFGQNLEIYFNENFLCLLFNKWA